MNCYNGEKFLKDSISSVVLQTYQNWELIFWDNQSTDNSAKIAKSFQDKRIKYYLSKKHTPLYEARGLAINKTKGDFIAFLDIDDWWKKEKLAIQIPYFDNPKIGLIHTNFYKINEIINKCYLNYKDRLPSGKVTNNLLKNYRIGWLTTIIRKKAYESLLKKFNSKYYIIGDFDLCIRLSFDWEFIYLANPLAFCRWHGKNLQITKANFHILELKNWYEENRTNSNLAQLDGFIFFKNNLNKMITINLIKNGLIKDAYESLKYINSSIVKAKLLILMMLPNKILNFIFKKIN